MDRRGGLLGHRPRGAGLGWLTKTGADRGKEPGWPATDAPSLVKVGAQLSPPNRPGLKTGIGRLR